MIIVERSYCNYTVEPAERKNSQTFGIMMFHLTRAVRLIAWD